MLLMFFEAKAVVVAIVVAGGFGDRGAVAACFVRLYIVVGALFSGAVSHLFLMDCTSIPF